MKNKALIGTLIALVILVAGSMIYDQTKRDSSKNDVVKIGILQYVTHDALDEIEKGIEDGLAEAGYDSDNAEITMLNAEGDQSKIQTMSKQLVNAKNDVLIGIATPAAQGLASATSDIPVVMGAISDPVGAKLVKNLEEPEGNVTGVSNQVPIEQSVELIQKSHQMPRQSAFYMLVARIIQYHKSLNLKRMLKLLALMSLNTPYRQQMKSQQQCRL